MTGVAKLQTVDLDRLQQGHVQEAATVSQAAKEDGCFYLGFSGRTCTKMIQMVQTVYDLSKDFLQMSEEEKIKYNNDLFGDLRFNG